MQPGPPCSSGWGHRTRWAPGTPWSRPRPAPPRPGGRQSRSGPARYHTMGAARALQSPDPGLRGDRMHHGRWCPRRVQTQPRVLEWAGHGDSECSLVAAELGKLRHKAAPSRTTCSVRAEPLLPAWPALPGGGSPLPSCVDVAQAFRTQSGRTTRTAGTLRTLSANPLPPLGPRDPPWGRAWRAVGCAPGPGDCPDVGSWPWWA